MSNVAVQFGYTDSAGLNAIAQVSPSPGTQTGIVSTVIASYEQLDITAQWVDGQPTWLVNLLATKLVIPAGTPIGWSGIVSESEELPGTTPNRSQRRDNHIHSFKFAGINPKLGESRIKGKLYRCSCGASQVRS